jgi:hypothetical protein
MPIEVENLVRTTVEKVRAKGGKVVGTIGFSQGTRVAAGLLRGSEIRRMVCIQPLGLLPPPYTMILYPSHILRTLTSLPSQIQRTITSNPSGDYTAAKVLLESTQWLDFQFGISVCGSYPPVLLPPCTTELLRAHLQPTAKPEMLEEEMREIQNQKIAAPTL